MVFDKKKANTETWFEGHDNEHRGKRNITYIYMYIYIYYIYTPSNKYTSKKHI